MMKRKPKRIAVVAARGFGDGLMALVASHHLTRAGHKVTTYNAPLIQLAYWFPDQQIVPYPEDPRSFSSYDLVLIQPHSLASENASLIETEKKTLPLIKGRTMVEGWRDLVQELGENATKDNGLSLPEKRSYRLHKKRVLIHPCSLDPRRCWKFKKFVYLCDWLTRCGWDPKLVMTQQERTQYPKAPSSYYAPLFPSLHELGLYVYESGYFIGNNSGVGHLASNLKIPTLSLFARESYASIWRPGWGPGLVALPFFPFFGTRIKQKLWASLLTTRKIKKYFNNLVVNY